MSVLLDMLIKNQANNQENKPPELWDSYKEPPKTEAGKKLYDTITKMQADIDSTPNMKVRFAGHTFEIMPKAKRQKIDYQIQLLRLLQGMKQDQTSEPGMFSRLLPAFATMIGSRDKNGGGSQWDQFLRMFGRGSGGGSGSANTSSGYGVDMSDYGYGDTWDYDSYGDTAGDWSDVAEDYPW